LLLPFVVVVAVVLFDRTNNSLSLSLSLPHVYSHISMYMNRAKSYNHTTYS
jgi:hypothetical protein